MSDLTREEIAAVKDGGSGWLSEENCDRLCDMALDAIELRERIEAWVKQNSRILDDCMIERSLLDILTPRTKGATE